MQWAPEDGTRAETVGHPRQDSLPLCVRVSFSQIKGLWGLGLRALGLSDSPSLTSPQLLQLMVPPGLQSLKTLLMTTGFWETV